MPYEVAKENLVRHAASEKYPPSISDLSRPIRDQSQKYHDNMRSTAEEHLASIFNYEQTAVGPTVEQREKVREIFERRTDRDASKH
ncbi:hypothetical protein D3C73_1181240 [compost metagenome]